MLAIIKDNTKFQNQKAKIVLETREGIIVTVKDYVITPTFFGLLSNSVFKDVEYFLFHTEFEKIEEIVIAPPLKSDHPPHNHSKYDIIRKDGSVDYYADRIRKEYEEKLLQAAIGFHNQNAIPNIHIPAQGNFTKQRMNPLDSTQPYFISESNFAYKQEECQWNEKACKCPRCHKYTTINESTLQLRCCGYSYEMLLYEMT